MTVQPTPDRTHLWDGTRTLPDWLPAHAHTWNGNQLVIRHPDGDTPMRPGWMLVHWTDGIITVASPRAAERVHGPGGLTERLHHAETALTQLAGPTNHMTDTRTYTARSHALVDAISQTLNRHGHHVPDTVLYAVADAIIRADAAAALDELATQPAATQAPDAATT